MARRYEHGSILITTNKLVTQWGVVFGDEVLAAAILVRMLQQSHLGGVSPEAFEAASNQRLQVSTTSG